MCMFVDIDSGKRKLEDKFLGQTVGFDSYQRIVF